MKKLFILIIIAMLLISCSQNTVKEDESAPSKPSVEASVSKKSEEPAQGAEDPHKEKAPVQKKIVVPDTVTAKFKSIILEVGHKKTNKAVDTDILIGQKAEVAGTPLTVELEAFLPDFMMSTDSITSKSAEENQPAVKVKVYRSEKLVFDGWLFKNFPDMHPFSDEDYTLTLKSAVQK